MLRVLSLAEPCDPLFVALDRVRWESYATGVLGSLVIAAGGGGAGDACGLGNGWVYEAEESTRC